MPLSEDKIEFRNACFRCKGKCCYGETGKEIIPLTAKEAEYLERNYLDLEIKIMNLYKGREMAFFYVPKTGCPLLKDKSCILDEEHKPLNCKIYPIIPLEKNGKLKFYLDKSGLCPEVENIEKLCSWKENTIREIKKDWKKLSKKERNFMSELTKVTESTNKEI